MATRSTKKAVLNVTIDESLAEEVRLAAALANSTISSVVEQALAEQLKWERIRRDGLKTIDEYYQQHGYPTEEEMAEAAAQVDEEHRLIDEALAAMDAERRDRYRTRGRAPSISASTRRARETAPGSTPATRRGRGTT
jgi:Post-segregation antitoxin CcdA